MEIIGSDNPVVTLFAKASRATRHAEILSGKPTPREFFYGYFHLLEAGIPTSLCTFSGPVAGLRGAIANAVERVLVALSGVGARPLSLRLRYPAFSGSKVLISCVDGISLSLGLSRLPPATVRIAGFQGLSDIERKAGLARPLAHMLILHILRRFDHVFFLSPADREQAIERYALQRDRTTLMPFCVDTEFWCPDSGAGHEDWTFAVGQDPNRDFDTLARAPGRHATKILTRLAVDLPKDASHIEVRAGGFSDKRGVTDVELRDLYRRALCVVVPLKDSFQPSGQSVTLQAMACGKPVILTRTRGFWDAEGLRDGENCILVEPSDAAAIGNAIGRLKSDPDLARRISAAARATAVERYDLSLMGREFVRLAQLGLSIAAKRQRANGG